MLRKPSRIYRATVTEIASRIVDVEADGVGSRRITLFVLDTPAIEIFFDIDPRAAASRDAYWCEPPGGHAISFEILPGQTVVGRAKSALMELSVLVEYLA